MEKFLRLLNPKSINYEADRIDGGAPELTAQDVLLAMGFAGLSQFQDVLIRLKYFGANTKANVKAFAPILASKYVHVWDQQGLNPVYYESITLIALTEFCLVPANYKASSYARSAICGWSQTTVYKHIENRVERVLNDLKGELALGEDKIFTQLNKIK